MSQKNDNALHLASYLEHILEAIQRIEQYTDNMIEATFLNNSLVQDGVVRNFEVIGEACRNISRYYPEFSKSYGDFPLGIAYEMRNALVHGYFKVDLEIVWNTLEKDLPELQRQVQEIYGQIMHKDDDESIK